MTQFFSTRKGWLGAGLTALLLLAVLSALLPSTGPATAAACQEVVGDGGFESGAGWQTTSGGGYALFNSFLPRSGAQSAHLAGVNSANDRAITSLALPAGHTITLSFWWRVHSEESGSGYDALSLTLTDSQGAPLYAIAGFTDLNASALWQQVQVDLSAFAGQTVKLQMDASTDGSLVTDFFVDDLSVSACGQASNAQRIFLPLTRNNR